MNDSRTADEIFNTGAGTGPEIGWASIKSDNEMRTKKNNFALMFKGKPRFTIESENKSVVITRR